ncbi:MAG TPA: hypothetical protein VGE76_14960 [Opitutaceae bacterium]
MDAPVSLTIVDGALAMDGGSVFLATIDDRGIRRSILLGWSIASQKSASTALIVDEHRLAKGSSEESAWIGAIASAQLAPIERPLPENRVGGDAIVLAKDAATILAAGANDPVEGLDALRNDLLLKIRSSTHTLS